jgi:uncharacterized protein (TIGR02118 family)
MLKRMTLLARRLDRTFDEFSAYWVGNHGEIVKRMPAVHGYIQNPIQQRLLAGLNPQDPFSFDGIVELWFADEAAQATAFASDAAKELPPDELNFIRGITIYPVTEERRQPQSAAVKVMFVARIPGQKVADSTAALADSLGANVVTVNYLGAVGWRDHLWHEPEAPNAIIELGFDTASAAQALATTGTVASAHANLASGGGALELYLVQPRRII